MSSRVRSCVECPKCHTRYLIGSSLHHNGSYIVAHPPAAADFLRLYCACSNFSSSYVFKFSELKMSPSRIGPTGGDMVRLKRSCFLTRKTGELKTCPRPDVSI
jgi:hypothetical protein